MSRLRGDVAIIGIACVFPGAPDLRSYWQNIVSKVDAVSDPPDGWGAELFYDPDSKESDRIYCKRGGYLKELARFDPLKYGVMPTSVDGGEPDHFLALKVAHDALADAGYLDRSTERGTVEVILGRGEYVNRGYTNLVQHGLIVEQTLQILKSLHPEHTPEELQAIRRELKAGLPPFNAEVAPGLVPNIVTGRIANRLDLMGPNFTVDAACASSLIAVEIGTQDLLARKCDIALVGGVHASTPPPILMLFCQLNALSRRGQIRPFDKDADGTLLGEGAGMIVLKRREDAERNGDRIYALIKGVGTASDGRALGLLAPRVEGEELALRRAYEASGIAPRSVGLIEAHGTGTLVGDVTEIQALSRVFGPREGARPSCAVGTVKSMISHLIPAAGVAGLIKVALALHHKILPPSLHCDEPNPKLELEKTPFYINTETRPWIHGGPEPRRAGVNAFGFGGINAHAILEEYSGGNEGGLPSLLHRWDTEVIILHAENRRDLIRRGEGLLRFLTTDPAVEVKDLAYTVNCPLPDTSHRLAIVAESPQDLAKKLTFGLQRLADPGCTWIKDRSGIFFFEEPLYRAGSLAFLFPGEGSQYANMLFDLCLHFPEVRACFDWTDQVSRAGNRDVLASEILFPPPGARSAARPPGDQGLWQMDIAVAAVFAADLALFRLLDRLEIRPHAMVGHSSGEFTALLASGALAVQSEDHLFRYGLELTRLHESMMAVTRPAALLTVGAADPCLVASVVAESNGALSVAMDNCPHQVILCGEKESVVHARDRLQARGAICGLLPFNRAYHTPQFLPVCDQLSAFFQGLAIVPPRTRLYSCATARPYPQDPREIRQLAVEQWASPVRFRETIEAMHAAGLRLFVEVGPRGNLTHFVDDILQGRRSVVVASNLPERSGITQLNYLLGLLAAHGVPMRLDYLYARRAPQRVPLDETTYRAASLEKWADGMRLTLELPRLRLDHTRKAVLAQALPASAGMLTESAGSMPAAATDQTLPRQAVPVAPHAHQSLRPVPADSSAPTGSRQPIQERQPAPGRRPEGRPQSVVMQAYMQTMERFLGVQRETVSAFMAGAGSQALGVHREKGNGRAAQADIPRPRELPAPEGPFGITVSSLTPGKEVIATCRIDLHEHTFLLHHTLGKHISALDETLPGLPVVPLTFSMEIMAQVASLLHRDRKLVGMKAVRAHRWIVAEEDHVTLLVAARQKPSETGEEVEVRILEASGKDGAALRKDLVFVEGTMVFGNEYPPSPRMEGFQLRAGRPYRYAPEEYYNEIMFHGPLFQSVVSIDRAGEDGIEASLQVLPATRLFRFHREPKLLTDPVLMDGAGQLVGFWVWEHLESGYVAFPIGLEALEIYGPWPHGPEPLKCYVRITLPDGGRVRATIDVMGPEGRMIVRVQAWEDMRLFDWTRQFFRFGLMPRDVMLSASWPSPVAHLPTALGFRCCLLSENGSGIWSRALAYATLNRRERKEWLRLTAPEKRRREWLLGRLAAKDAVRLLLKDRYQMELCPADIEILTDEHGRPLVGGEHLETIGCRLALSIAHAGGVAAAIVGDSTEVRGVGIDVEPIDRSHEGLERVATTAQEQALLAAIPSPQKEEWLLRIWCAKEAVGKALGRGMLGGPLGIRVQSLDAEGGRVTLTLAGELAAQFPERAAEVFAVATGRDGRLVFATVLA